MRRAAFLIMTTAVVAIGAALSVPRHSTPAEVTADSRTLAFHVEGMTCALCKYAVEKALAGVAGVEQSNVDASSGRAVVTARSDVRPDTLVSAISAAGYRAQPIDEVH